MSDWDWERLYLGKWNESTERERFLESLADEYHSCCDMFDEVICTGRHDRVRGKVPANSSQASIINEHAKAVMRRLLKNGEKWSITKEELFKAIQNHGSNQR
jgi:hypothetical protein